MTTGIRNYPRKLLTDRERTIREALERFLSLPSTSPGTVLTVKKTSDQVIATATLTDVTQLFFPVINGGYYAYKFILLARSASQFIGVSATVTYPSVTTAGATVQTLFAADGAASLWAGAITASADPVTATDVSVIDTDYVTTIEGVIVPSAAGILQVQVANETGATNLTVRQGSCGILTVV